MIKKAKTFIKIKRTVTVHIAVMDYGYGEIRMFTAELPQEWQDEDAIAWLEKHDEKWSNDQCYYMSSEDEIEVRYE